MEKGRASGLRIECKFYCGSVVTSTASRSASNLTSHVHGETRSASHDNRLIFLPNTGVIDR